MESGTFYVCRNVNNRAGPQIQSHCQDEGKAQKQKGSRCLALITVSLGLICVLLLVFSILQHITITTERDLIKSYKNIAKEFNQTINSLQDNYTDLMIEKHQLQNNFNSCSHNMELETRVKDLTAQKDQLQRDFDYLSQKKVELESRVRSLSDELKKVRSKASVWGPDNLYMSDEEKSWSDSRQYCRDHGGDLVIINSEEKQRIVSSYIKLSVWIGLSDIENEGSLKWVDNSPLKQGFFFPHEPNDGGGNEDCVEMQFCTYCSASNLNTWNDLPCNDYKKAVCEK